MGLLDAFKKKSQDSASSSTSLNDLPPIPQNPFSDDSNSAPVATEDNLPPLPEVETPLPTPDDSTPSMDADTSVDSGLEVPSPVNTQPEESLENIPVPSDTTPDENSLTADPDEVPSPEESKAPIEIPMLDEDQTSNQVPDDLIGEVPQPEPPAQESEPDSSSIDFAADVPNEDAPADSTPETKSLDEPSQDSQEEFSENNLPNFQELQDDITQERMGEQMSSDPISSTDIRTESMLLKSIFVEREHYANILFSLKRVKDDLEKSGPQQRKLNHVDMKLAKEYAKLSTLYENFNENLMVIEHILSNEQF